jgi:hypothetical protein
MEKLKNPGIKHIPNGNKHVPRLILLINNLIISALRSSKKNIQDFKRPGGYFFSIAVLTLNHSHTNK